MMKVKVTDKQLREGYYVIQLGYCDAQNVLNFQPARFYNYGVYGWRYDVYELDFNLAICTGYSPIRSIPKKLNEQAVEIIRRYDKKAKAMRYKDYKKYDNYRRALDRLYKKMVEELDEHIVCFIPLIVSGKSYQERKADLQAKAIEWSNNRGEYAAWSYGELAIIQGFFETNGRRYGLLKEFKENCIC